MYKIINDDNMKVICDKPFDYIYSDMIYENLNFDWIDYYWTFLKEGGIFAIQTDFHSISEVVVKMKTLPDNQRICKYVWKCEWGNHPKDRPHECYDEIVLFSKGKHKKFDSSVIQIPKATAKTKLNPSGRETKTATAWIDDVCLTTTSNERVKKSDGHLIKWQKPLKLFDRILAPYTNEGDDVLDNFMGSGSLGEWCIRNNRNYVGIEKYFEPFSLAKERLEKCSRHLVI